MSNSKQLNWLFDDCIPYIESTPVKEIKRQVLKPARDYKIVPVPTTSREPYSDYRRKIIARLRAAKNPKEIATLMNRI